MFEIWVHVDYIGLRCILHLFSQAILDRGQAQIEFKYSLGHWCTLTTVFLILISVSTHEHVASCQFKMSLFNRNNKRFIAHKQR